MHLVIYIQRKYVQQFPTQKYCLLQFLMDGKSSILIILPCLQPVTIVIESLLKNVVILDGLSVKRWFGWFVMHFILTLSAPESNDYWINENNDIVPSS
jgi:hypothetical protein